MAKRLKEHHKDRMLAALAAAVLLFLLLWWAAAHYHWGPYRIKATTPTTSAVGSGSSSASSGTSGAGGTNGTNGTNGTSGTIPAPAGAGTPIFNLYGSIHNSETGTDVQASAGGLDPSCVTLSSTPGSVQKVCTYQSGDKVVTVAYLNDNVVSVSKSGF